MRFVDQNLSLCCSNHVKRHTIYFYYILNYLLRQIIVVRNLRKIKINRILHSVVKKYNPIQNRNLVAYYLHDVF